MRHIKVPVPLLPEQQRLAAPSKKQAIMRAYLS
jgi:hypothetical protein